MTSENFWKKVIIFSLTFLLGFFTADFSAINEISETKQGFELPSRVSEISTAVPHIKNKNCVAADENLKYQTLPFDESGTNSKFRKLPYPDPENKSLGVSIDRIIGLKVQVLLLRFDLEGLKESDAKRKKEIQTKIKKIEEELQLWESFLEKSSNYPKSQTLLYLEECSDK